MKRIAKCYREKDDNSIGWCGTNIKDDIDNQEFDIDSGKGWGFCPKECLPNQEKPLFGLPNVKEINILDANFCESKLTRNGTISFEVKPEVLCVALNMSYNIRTYLKGQEEDDYYHVSSADLEKHPRLQVLADRENKRYIVGKFL